MHSSCTRNDVATMAPARLMYAACRFPNALLADGTGSYGRHSGVQPLQTHSSTLTTHGDHLTTWSGGMHSSCARNDVATKAPERLVYAAWRFPNALLADVWYRLLQSPLWRTTLSKHMAWPLQNLVTITQL